MGAIQSLGFQSFRIQRRAIFRFCRGLESVLKIQNSIPTRK